MPQDLVLHPHPGELVQRPERLVQQQHLRVVDQRPGQGRPLGHAAGELVRVGVGERFQADQSQELLDLVPRCRRSTPRATSPAWMLRRTVSQGNRLGSWNISPRSAPGPVIGSAPTRSSPDVGRSRPAISRRSVDLPQPLGPISDTISPAAIDSERRSSASTVAPSAARNALLTSRIAQRRRLRRSRRAVARS